MVLNWKEVLFKFFVVIFLSESSIADYLKLDKFLIWKFFEFLSRAGILLTFGSN